MSGRIIPAVNSNEEKQQTYRNRIEKYKLAVKYGFYCEAVMITYAMIEDRLRSMIYHMAFLLNRKANSIWKKTRPFLLECVETYGSPEENLTLGINSLSGKIKIIRSVYRWAALVEGGYEKDIFANVLKQQIEGTDIEAVLSTLDDIERWKACRNEITHSMMNKNIDSLEAILQPQALEGMRIARALDAEERKLKKGNRIRRKMKLLMD